MCSWIGSRDGSISGNEPGSGRRREAGFTLLEILIAFIILALALGALLPSFSNGLRSVGISATHITAMMQARSIIDRVGLDIPLQDGEVSGTAAGGIEWVVRIHRVEFADAARLEDDGRMIVVPMGVEVAVSQDGEPAVTLSTLRLALIE